MTIDRSILLGLFLGMGCLPINAEHDHALEGYNSSSTNRPNHIAAAEKTICAATEQGYIRCWGARSAPWSSAELPTDVAQMVKISTTSVTTSAVCGLDSLGRVLCAGDNGNGQVGIGLFADEAQVVLPNSEGFFETLKSGPTTTCARRLNEDNIGQLTCWGNTEYQVFQGLEDSNDHRPFRLRPEIDGDLIETVIFDVGKNHICTMTINPQRIVCWGRQTATADNFPTDPRVVTTLPETQSILDNSLCLGLDHACAVIDDMENNGIPTVSCWGDNTYGQVNPRVDTVGGQLALRKLPSLTNVKGLFCGSNHTCALGRDDRTIRCWGDNRAKQLGGEPDEDGIAAVSVLPAIEFEKIAAGEDFTCALGIPNEGHPLYCWGSNAQGQLGTGDLVDATERAVVVDFFHDVDF